MPDKLSINQQNEALLKQVELLEIEKQDLKDRLFQKGVIIKKKNEEISGLRVEKNKLKKELNRMKRNDGLIDNHFN